MSEEHDSWFKQAFGVDLGESISKIKDQAVGAVEQAKNTVTGSFPLSGSVGRGGKNAPNDVRAVQTALGIAADGKCGPQTFAAIEAFQKTIGQAKPDGRFDAGGATERALTGRSKPTPPLSTTTEGELIGSPIAREAIVQLPPQIISAEPEVVHTLPPVIVEGGKAPKESKDTMVQFRLRDYDDGPLTGYRWKITFVGITGARVTKEFTPDGSTLTAPFLLEPSGSVEMNCQLVNPSLVDLLENKAYASSLTSGSWKFERKGSSISFNVTQGAQPGTETGATVEEVKRKLQQSGTGGVVVGPVQVGVGGSEEKEKTDSKSKQVTWNIKRPTKTVTITQA